jgi:ribosomal protein S18 acetylase RimI-like enzyme
MVEILFQKGIPAIEFEPYLMNNLIIRNVLPKDLDECFQVEISGFSPEEAASKETIQLRIATFPQGFLVAELDGSVIGMLNSAATNKDDISDEALKQLIGHDPQGRNMVVFALAVLPAYRRQGVARQLMQKFSEEARQQDKANILLICKQHLIAYYASMGFEHVGLSKSTHGGAAWHEMRLSL